jgi:hypothetical protein
MVRNVGAVDSYIRVLIGVAFLLNIFALKTGVIGTIVLLVLALISLVTAYTGYCGLYKIFNISTSPSTSALPDAEPQSVEENKQEAATAAIEQEERGVSGDDKSEDAEGSA